ncbi:hypothetical protein ASPZODRAFT_24937 [Penicilliopsis zonata CBS 506.65]|uniref:RNase III domain-containing protein n=1 Tax=Penicilliopsis zonata CBS 506.65 TaxID=1073090 RepID=A0A1L9SHY0_9EURO|nr:hypothetical protein ASPZODRAFT_24937 [Penicilliopsis zonata CBS 506.65]OJJ46830.1 hypothetical protein ASPZODRAFT_24937 [Penicilliopsis zonata CBS 506.65]
MSTSVYSEEGRVNAICAIASYNPSSPTTPHLITALHAPFSFSLIGNRHLALVGDAVLRLVLTLGGFHRTVNGDTPNDVLSTVLSNAHLAQRGFELGIDQFIYINPTQAAPVSENVVASTVKAILGAVFLDSGKNIAAVERSAAAMGIVWLE